MTSKPEVVWAFDLGKGSIGEAVRQGNQFLRKAPPLISAFKANKKGADRLREAPYGSHRSYLTAEAARLFPTYRGRPTGFDPHSS